MRLPSQNILIVIVVAVFCMAGSIYFAYERERARRVTDQAYWPRPIQALVTTSPELKSAIKIYDLQGFMDENVLVSISGRADVVHKIIQDFGLAKTDQNHRHASHLLKSIPRDWNRPPPTSDWYTTPGFGTVHREGTDLFLIAIDPASGDAVIYYNWNF
jgi:hypothetical protein